MARTIGKIEVKEIKKEIEPKPISKAEKKEEPKKEVK